MSEQKNFLIGCHVTMPKQTKIVLSGGGTAGHVLPHFVFLPLYKKWNWDVLYIGTSGIEKKLVTEDQASEKIRFRTIRAGKLRRHFSFQNFLDIFWVIFGTLQSFFILLKERPQIAFLKGGYVSVPVALAAWILRIPIVTHESDLSPGLANKIIARFSKKILCTFPNTVRMLPAGKAQFVGLPVRPELAQGNKAEGYALCNFRADDTRPVLLVMGGSQGATRVNQAIESTLPELLKSYRVIHITGQGKQNGHIADGYFQEEYVSGELKHLMAITDFVVCRAGANSIFEMLMLKKPMLLIPLEIGSRGDQVQNARAFKEKNWALVLRETEISPEKLLESISELKQHSDAMKRSMEEFPAKDLAQSIFSILESIVKATHHPI